MKTLTKTDVRLGISVDDCECNIGRLVPMNRLRDAMTLTTFENIIDSMPELTSVTLQGTGEPVLVPNVMEMIRRTRRRGITVTLDSNGSLLYRDRAEELVDTGLNRLRVLMDGFDVRYEGDKPGPERNFGPILENLAGLTAARRGQGSNLVVEVVFIADPDNLAQLPDTVALLASAQVDEVRVWQSPRVDPEAWELRLRQAQETADEYWLPLHPPQTAEETIDDRPYFGLGPYDCACRS